jgi:hypothetical protein
LLSKIMSSPLTSSATGDYIKAHQKEYNEIIVMGEGALPYLTGMLDGGDRGLRGNIVMQLCKDIVKNLTGNKDIQPTTDILALSCAGLQVTMRRNLMRFGRGQFGALHMFLLIIYMKLIYLRIHFPPMQTLQSGGMKRTTQIL